MPTPQTLLVTGGSGYLGQHLLPVAAQQFHLVAAYRGQSTDVSAGEPIYLDLTNAQTVRRIITELRPDAIIHAAAINPGRGDEALMQQINVDGSRAVAEAAALIGARLVYVSTDVVHDGKNAPYADDAAPSPLNAYGRSKAAAETAVSAACPEAAIVRTSLIYGLEAMDRGTEGFVKRLESGGRLLLFSDVIRQPVWVSTLTAALLKLVNLDFAGLLNVAGRQALTREDFGRQMLAWWGIDAGERVGSGRATDISDTIPLDLRLPVEKGERLLEMPFPGVDAVLAVAGDVRR